jgi:radical SAM superfamily enzyme YgiQ (UPF0313 family)
MLFRIASKGKELGMKICFLLMVGFPGETRESILMTADIIRKCRPFSIGLSFPVNYPDTQFDIFVKNRKMIVKKDKVLTDGSCPIIESFDFHANEIRER